MHMAIIRVTYILCGKYTIRKGTEHLLKMRGLLTYLVQTLLLLRQEKCVKTLSRNVVNRVKRCFEKYPCILTNYEYTRQGRTYSFLIEMLSDRQQF